MQVVDLTMELGPSTPVYPGFPRPAVLPWYTHHAQGASAYIIYAADHTATHVDAPDHFAPGGKTIDQVELSKFMGRIVTIDVSDLPPRGSITVKLFEERLPRGVELGPGWIVAFRTGYDAYAGTERWLRHPAVSPELAEHLAGLRINAVGVDSSSPDHVPKVLAEAVARFMGIKIEGVDEDPPWPVHRILLPREVLIYENLTNLAPLVGRVAQFYGLPLKITRGSGSPVRAVAFL